MPVHPTKENRRRASPMDEYVGKRIRLRRRLLGWTQNDLAKRLAITFQQVQKYEWGANRVGAGRLFDLSIALDVPIQFFYEGGPGTEIAITKPTRPDDFLLNRDSLAMVQAFNGIEDQDCRQKLLDLCETLSNWSQSEQSSSSPT